VVDITFERLQHTEAAVMAASVCVFGAGQDGQLIRGPRKVENFSG